MKQEWSQQITVVDGRGAEVIVEKGVGTVQRLDPSSNGKTINVYIRVDAPKIRHPFSGWLQVTDTDLIDILEEALATKRQVHFRIEMQRKNSIDPDIPMKDLRPDMDTAAKNTVRKFTAVQFVDVNADLVESSEVGTDPSNDPQSGRTVRAQPNTDSATASAPVSSTPTVIAGEQVTTQQLRETAESKLPRTVLDHLAALALSQGMPIAAVQDAIVGKKRPVDQSTTQDNRGARLAREEQAWKEFNSDGSRNLGYLGIMGVVSAEHIVTSAFVKREVINSDNILDYEKSSMVNHIVSLVIAIADRVFVTMYGQNMAIDRSANSHTRARGITYDTIETILPIPQITTLEGNVEVLQAWARSVYDIVLHRFSLAVRVSVGRHEKRPIVDKNIYVNTLESTTGELSGQEVFDRMKALWESEKLGDDKQGLAHLLGFIFGERLLKDIPTELMIGFLEFYESEEHSLGEGIQKFLELSQQ